MRVIDNVDVCVTCVSVKPPVLPLREELPSLGVELVYNAKGTGMRGVRRKYRDAKKVKEKQKQKAGPLSRVKKTIDRKFRHKTSKTLSDRTPKKKALSYDSYHLTSLRAPGSSVASSGSHKTYSTKSVASSIESVGKMAQHWGDNPAVDDCRNVKNQERDRVGANDFGILSLGDTRDVESRPKDAEAAKEKYGWWYEAYEDSKLNLSYTLDSQQSRDDDYVGVTSAEDDYVGVTSAEDDYAGVTSAESRDEGSVGAFLSDDETFRSKEEFLGAMLEEWNESFRHMCCLSRLLDIKEEQPLSFSVSQDSDMKMLLARKDLKREQERSRILLEMMKQEESSQLTTKMGTSKIQNKPSDTIDNGGKNGEKTLNKHSPYENELFGLLSRNSAPEDVKDLIDAKPNLVQAVVKESGQMPLHYLCDRGLPLRHLNFDNKKEGPESTDADRELNGEHLMDVLLEDITNFRVMLKVVAWAHVDACCIPDKKANLPVHILAKRLIEWEGWLNNVKEVCDTSISNEARITTLYRTMSQCIEVVLRPIVGKRILCRARGSDGMLPLHIASIFGASYDTLRLMLDVYKEGALVPCKVKDFKNGTEQELLPLELFEQRKTEHAYCERENDDCIDSASTGIQWTSSTLDNGHFSDDLVRKSDLIFAYNPNVLPYRLDQKRLERMESMVRTEAKQKQDQSNGMKEDLSVAAISIWIFMCTFSSKTDKDDHYAESVKQIVQDLDSVALLKLISIHDDSGNELLEASNPLCSKAIKVSLQRAVQEQESSSPYPSTTSHEQKEAGQLQDSRVGTTEHEKEGHNLEKKSILKNSKVASKSSSDVIPSQEIGRLCKKIFGIKEDSLPTSFVILPYRLKQEKDGALTLASPKDAELALKFAQSLIKLTEAPALLHTLENKFRSKRGGYQMNEATKLYPKEKQDVENDILVFLSLYTSNIGYLYLLDERCGVPQIKSPSSSISAYPFIISNAYATVKKLLPLMQMGMTLMRGDIALQVLGQVICFGNNLSFPPSWVGASQEIVTLLYSTKSVNGLDSELLDNLMEFASTISLHAQKYGLDFQDGSEWVVELSFLKILLEKFDGRKTYAGLQAARKKGVTVWTSQIKEGDEVAQAPDQNDVQIDFRFHYDALIHSSVSYPCDQSSEVSSITSARTPMDDSFLGQIPLTEHGIPMVIHTLSAVDEEEMAQNSLGPNELANAEVTVEASDTESGVDEMTKESETSSKGTEQSTQDDMPGAEGEEAHSESLASEILDRQSFDMLLQTEQQLANLIRDCRDGGGIINTEATEGEETSSKQRADETSDNLIDDNDMSLASSQQPMSSKDQTKDEGFLEEKEHEDSPNFDIVSQMEKQERSSFSRSPKESSISPSDDYSYMYLSNEEDTRPSSSSQQQLCTSEKSHKSEDRSCDPQLELLEKQPRRDMIKGSSTELKSDDDVFSSAQMEFEPDSDIFHSARMKLQPSPPPPDKHRPCLSDEEDTKSSVSSLPEIDSFEESHKNEDLSYNPRLELEKEQPGHDVIKGSSTELKRDSELFSSAQMEELQPLPSPSEGYSYLGDEEDTKSTVSSLPEIESSEESHENEDLICDPQAVREKISAAIPAHSSIRKVKFVLLGPSKSTALDDADRETVGISVLDEEENVLESESLMTTGELLAFVKDSKEKETIIKEKDAQIKEMEDAISTFDHMRKEELFEKEEVIRKLSSKLQLYEGEVYDKNVEKDNVSTAENGDAIELTLVLSESVEGTKLLQMNSVSEEVQSGMMARVYDLEHKNLEKDIEIEQLKLALHARELAMMKQKEEEIANLRQQLRGKEIQIRDFEEKLAHYIKPEDGLDSSEGSSSK